MALSSLTLSRHILQEMTVSSYVPNDTLLMGGTEQSTSELASMLLLTGPNYSGKSVYMKQVSIPVPLDHQLARLKLQVALIVYLAQIGRYGGQSSDRRPSMRLILLALFQQKAQSLVLLTRY